MSVDSVIINNAGYNSSLTITQLDDVLYKAHLRNRETIDLQPYVNNIKINYVQKEINLSTDSYVNPAMTFYSKGFMYDEVYALYASFIIDDNGEYETQAYHVPGREAVNVDLGGATINPSETENISTIATAASPNNYCSNQYFNSLNPQQPFNKFYTIDPINSKIFHAVTTNDNPLASTNMGYYENKDENYSLSDKWITLDSTGTPISGKDYRGQNVRHHKFPEAYNHNLETLTPYAFKSMHPSATNYNLVNLLGIQLSDVVIPDELVGKVKKINIYYAKRDLNNRTILGQSLLQSLSQIKVGNVNDTGTQDTVWNNGGQMVNYSMPDSTNKKQSGLFPVGYQRTTYQSTNKWSYSDEFFTNPTFWTKGYYKFKSFDLMQQSLDVSSGVYIKNLYRVKSIYKAKVLGGDLGNRDSNMYTGFIYDPTNSTVISPLDYGGPTYFGGIDKLVNNDTALFNHIRQVTASSYIAKNFPNQRDAVSNSPYPFVAIPFNYGGQTGIWLETDYYLYSWNLAALFQQQGNDVSYISHYSNPSFQLDAQTGVYASPYISNLCVFKLNIFQSFENQILCLAGSFSVGDAFFNAYGGDTFTTVNSDIDGIDLAGYSPQGGGGGPIPPVNARPQNQLKSIHCYITQSTANPNYRYEGDNSWETFYPYSTADQMFGIPQSDPEWYGYNIDYSAVNDLKQPVIASNFDNQLQDYFPNRVIRSAKDNPEIQQDNYLDYQAGDYKDFGKIKGKIRNITNQNNKLLIKTDNALYATLGREVISTENAEANVTSGDIFAVKPREIVSSDSYGGGLGRFADVVTQYGYFYPDTTNGIVYNFDGNGVDEISKAGQQIFFRNELKFKLPQIIDNALFNTLPIYTATTYLSDYFVTYNGKVWKSTKNGSLSIPGTNNDWIEVDFRFNRIDSIIDTQSIGVQAAFDYKYRRYILTKKDYNFIGYPVSFIGNLPDNVYQNDNKIVWFNGVYYKIFSVPTANLAPPNSTLLTTRIYNDGIINVPYLVYGVEVNFETDFNMTPNRFTVAYYPESQAWVSFYDYYPDYLTYSIDRVYSFSRTNLKSLFRHNSDLHNSFYYNRVVPYESFVEPILNEPKGCRLTSSFSIKSDAFRKDNTLDYLQSFTKYFLRNSYQISKEEAFINTQTSRNAEGYFNINTFRDFTKNNAEPLMTTGIINYPNGININPNKHWSKQKKFVDYYIIPRLTYTTAFETVNTSLSHTAGTNFLVTSAIFELGDIIRFTVGPTTYTYIITNPTNKIYIPISETEAGNFTINSFLKAKTRQINLLDINRLEHKNNR